MYIQQDNYNIQSWITHLTKAGFDIAKLDGHTSRNEHGLQYGAEGYNHNMPMPSMTLYFEVSKECPNPKQKYQRITVRMYAPHATQWRIYAIAYSGKTGRTETEIDDLKELIELLPVKD